MNKNINANVEYRKKLSDAKGKRMLQKVKINYSQAIIESLNEGNNELLLDLLDDLGVTEDYLFKCLSGKIDENITFYDQTISSISEKKKYIKEKPKKIK